MIHKLVQPISDQINEDKQEFYELSKKVTKMDDKLESLMQLLYKTSKKANEVDEMSDVVSQVNFQMRSLESNYNEKINRSEFEIKNLQLKVEDALRDIEQFTVMNNNLK